jgi:Na+/H+-dicarboxylate symporter
MDLVVTGQALAVETPSLSQIFKNVIPTNIFAALVSGNILQVIVFSLLLGITINLSGEKGKPLLKFMDSLAEVMYKMTALVMRFAPYAVFAIMASVAGSFGIDVLYPLLKFLLAYYAACAVHVAFVFCGILRVMARLHPAPFFRGMRDALMMAFSTCSSSATLPITIHCASANLGASKNIASFVLPLGITFNMNGTAIYQASAALFVAQAYNIPLEFTNIVTIIVTATLSSIGAAGVPGSGFIMLSAVLSSVGLPLEGLAVLFGIDRLREMVATTMNIAGDAVVAVYISKSEGELDEQKYYSTENVLYQPEQAV